MVLLFWKENQEKTEGWKCDCESSLTTAADGINQETFEGRKWGKILSPAQQEKSSTFSKALLQLLSGSHRCLCGHDKSTLAQVKDETKITVKAAATETGQMLN